MILHSVNLTYKDRLRLRGISDTHIGARAAEEKRLKRDIETVLSEPDSYVVLLGDQVEAITRQDLRRFAGSSVREDLLGEIDSLLNAQLREAVKTFRPLADAGRIIGALTGNHEQSIKQNYSFDIHKSFCEALGIKDLGYTCLVRLTISKEGQERSRNVIVRCHHGHGGSGKYTGASVNSMEVEAGWIDHDIQMMGHNHKRHASTRTVLSMTQSGLPRLIERDIVSIRTGGYYKTYQEGPANYAEIKGYPPTKIGDPPYVDIFTNGHFKDLHMTVTQ